MNPTPLKLLPSDSHLDRHSRGSHARTESTSVSHHRIESCVSDTEGRPNLPVSACDEYLDWSLDLFAILIVAWRALFHAK